MSTATGKPEDDMVVELDVSCSVMFVAFMLEEAVIVSPMGAAAALGNPVTLLV